MNGLLTKRKVKMDGYWANSFFTKKEQGQYSSQLDQTSLIYQG